MSEGPANFLERFPVEGGEGPGLGKALFERQGAGKGGVDASRRDQAAAEGPDERSVSLFNPIPVLAKHQQVVSRIEGSERYVSRGTTLVHRAHLQVVGEADPFVANSPAQQIGDYRSREAGRMRCPLLEGGVVSVAYHDHGTKLSEFSIGREILPPKILGLPVDFREVLMRVNPAATEPREVLATSKDSLPLKSRQKKTRELRNDDGVSSVGPIADPVGCRVIRQVQDWREVDVESQEAQAATCLTGVLPDEIPGGAGPGQKQVGRNGGEDPFETVDASPFLVNGNEGDNRESFCEVPAEGCNLRGFDEVPREENYPGGADRSQLPSEALGHLGAIDPDEQELTGTLRIRKRQLPPRSHVQFSTKERPICKLPGGT